MKKVKLFILVATCIFSKTLLAQQTDSQCGTEILTQQWEDEFQRLVSDFKLKQQANKSTQSIIYTIPVIFHIIHGGEPVGTFPNLAQGQINSQLTVTNQDFSGTGFNVGNYPANAFINWVASQALPTGNVDGSGRVKIADVGVQFCLAEKDTLGNILPEPGIDRINYITKGWSNPNTFSTTTTLSNYLNGTIKPQSIWNPKKYLNIWISDRTSALQFTGVATYPPLSGLTGIGGPGVGTDTTDGVWCYAKALGSYNIYPSGIYASPSVCGRTVTHEAGHYLGLRHIWGDGSCATDYCNDTPPAAAQNTGNPTYPLNIGSCASPSNSPDGEMFMNFMDYPSDPNKYMFTIDQAIRMQTALLNSSYRNQLGTHGLCSATTGINESLLTSSTSVYPNPTTGLLHIQSAEKIQNIRIYTLSGETILETNSNALSIENLPAGMYFLSIITNTKTETIKIIKE